MTAADRLSEILTAMPRSMRLALAKRYNIASITMGRATHGLPINPDAYLTLCSVAGIDPVSGEYRPPKPFAIQVDWSALALAVRLTLHELNLDLRTVAQFAQLSPPTLCRARAGHPLSVKSLLRICDLVGVPLRRYEIGRTPAANTAAERAAA